MIVFTFPEPSRTLPPRLRSLVLMSGEAVIEDALPMSDLCFRALPVVLLRDKEDGIESEKSVDISPDVRFRAFLAGETSEPERTRLVGTAGTGESART